MRICRLTRSKMFWSDLLLKSTLTTMFYIVQNIAIYNNLLVNFPIKINWNGIIIIDCKCFKMFLQPFLSTSFLTFAERNEQIITSLGAYQKFKEQ